MAGRPYDRKVWRRVIRPYVLARDGGVCQIRGPRCSGAAVDVDHVVPWQKGGSWFGYENLRAACAPCNRGKESPVAGRVRVRVPSREW